MQPSVQNSKTKEVRYGEAVYYIQPGDTFTVNTNHGNCTYNYEDLKMDKTTINLDDVLRSMFNGEKGCCGNKQSFKCLYIAAGASKGIIIPLEQLDSLYEFKIVEGDVSKGNLTYSREQLDIRVIDYGNIGDAKPDPKEVKAKRDAYRKKLQAELEALDAEG